MVKNRLGRKATFGQRGGNLPFGGPQAVFEQFDHYSVFGRSFRSLFGFRGSLLAKGEGHPPSDRLTVQRSDRLTVQRRPLRSLGRLRPGGLHPSASCAHRRWFRMCDHTACSVWIVAHLSLFPCLSNPVAGPWHCSNSGRLFQGVFGTCPVSSGGPSAENVRRYERRNVRTASSFQGQTLS